MVEVCNKFGGPTNVRKNSKKYSNLVIPLKNGPLEIFVRSPCAPLELSKGPNLLPMLVSRIDVWIMKVSKKSMK